MPGLRRLARSSVEPFVWMASVAILLVDLLLPAGFAVGVAYVGVMVSGLWIRRRRFLPQYTATGTVLILVGLVLPVEPDRLASAPWTMAAFNRAMSLSAFWITAGGIWLYRRATDAREAAEARLREQAALAELGRLGVAIALEVRNVLAGVGPSLRLVHDSIRPGNESAEVLDLAARRLMELDDTLTDLLASVDTRSPAPAPLPVRELVGEAVTMLRARPVGGAIAVQVDVPDVTVQGDHALLRRAIFNVLLNASQAMNGTGEVTVRVTTASGRWRLEVADRGPGLSPAARARLFEPFSSTKSQGIGLGLAFVKRVITQHGGTVDVISPSEGGTVVTLDLPSGIGPGADGNV